MRKSLPYGLAVALAMAVFTVPTWSAPAAAAGDQPATSTAVEVFTTDPYVDQSTVAPEVQRAWDIAMDRARANPTEYATPYISNSGYLAVPLSYAASATTMDKASQAMSIDSSPLDETNAGTPTMVFVYPSVYRVAHSHAALDGILDTVLDRRDIPSWDLLREAYLQPDKNRVVVTAAAVDEALREGLATAYGTSAIAIQLVPGLVAPERESRQYDSSPFKGGGYFSGAEVCSTGFSWTHEGVSYILTAGHCTSLNGEGWTWSYHVGTVVEDTWNNSTGSVRVHGQSYYVGDASLVKLYSSYSSSPRVFSGGPTSSTTRAVVGRSTVPTSMGTKFCVSGKTQGEVCGFTVTSYGLVVRWSDGTTMRNAMRGNSTGKCTRGGDSGAPVYTIKTGSSSVIARGVHAGGNATDGNCRVYFSDIYYVEKGLPGIVKLS
ncbi:MAG: hypothetical protein HOV77_05855 [Hamadaea sp.]|uniref:S1 family peptidase n=1 Tax=Hamadaea sp. TaxID=2024425 RepID=UPI001851A2D3|nr:S1 family peptidase [Hamadaea sp.]NUT18689.1 hypothetical protein [Hamadaea sp.]